MKKKNEKQRSIFVAYLIVTIAMLVVSLEAAIVTHEFYRSEIIRFSDTSLRKVAATSIDDEGNINIIIKEEKTNLKNEVIKVFFVVLAVSEVIGIIVVILIKKFIINQILIDNARNKQASEHDGLTGICNVMKFQNRVPIYNECKSLAIFFLDLNNLKEANDKYGHETGDKLICKVAHYLEKYSNMIDESMDYFRFGGDEFVVVLPNLKEVRAKAIFKDLISQINKLTIRVCLDEISISVASGFVFSKSENSFLDVEELVRIADANMYTDKNKLKKKKK